MYLWHAHCTRNRRSKHANTAPRSAALRCATTSPSSEAEVEQPKYWAGNYPLDDLIYPAGEADGGGGGAGT
jgi:hypothetical protein